LADLAENLRAFLLADSSIAAKVGSRVVQDIVGQDRPRPFIWYQRTGITKERCLGETANTPFSHTFAVECIGESLDDVEALAILVNARCESAACGTSSFGGQSVSNVFCEDQSAEYEPKGADLNSGLYIAPLQVEVYP